MNNKIFIGSIIAITILIGVSFTSVVGYNCVASDVKASPLFNIRSSRAIDEEDSGLSCEYVGKGDSINLLIPDRDDKIELMQKGIELFQGMDDITFNKLINFITNRNRQDNTFNDLDIKEVIVNLNKLRDNPDLIIKNYDPPETIKNATYCWFPGCLFAYFLLFMSIIIFAIIWIIAWEIFEPTMDPTALCYTNCCVI